MLADVANVWNILENDDPGGGVGVGVGAAAPPGGISVAVVEPRVVSPVPAPSSFVGLRAPKDESR